MKYVIINTDLNGYSHVMDEEWMVQESDFTPPSPAGYFVTGVMETDGVLMMHHPAGYRDEWHTAPAPVLGTVLTGVVRISTSDGDERVLKPGDQFLAADLTGRGHKMEEVNGEAYDLCLVVLKDAQPSHQASAA